MPRRYASQTAVSIAKSRGEIDKTLRRWGADQLQWSDDFKGGHAMLRFIWEHEGTSYTARFLLKLSTEEELRKESVDGRSGQFSQTKFEKAMSRAGMVEHRELALFIKAVFVAVEAGIITAEQVFLPFLEGMNGVTVAEAIIPQLPKLAQFSAVKLLTS